MFQYFVIALLPTTHHTRGLHKKFMGSEYSHRNIASSGNAPLLTRFNTFVRSESSAQSQGVEETGDRDDQSLSAGQDK